MKNSDALYIWIWHTCRWLAVIKEYFLFNITTLRSYILHDGSKAIVFSSRTSPFILFGCKAPNCLKENYTPPRFLSNTPEGPPILFFLSYAAQFQQALFSKWVERKLWTHWKTDTKCLEHSNCFSGKFSNYREVLFILMASYHHMQPT